MTTETAPERQPSDGPSQPPPSTAASRFLILARDQDDVTAVELATGALVRLRVPWQSPEDPPEAPPYAVVDAVVAGDPENDDLAHPEALTLAGEPQPAGALHGRQVRKLLRHLLAPPTEHLLGFPGSSWPYWQFEGNRPSAALVEPTQGPVLFRRRSDDSAWARFGWPRSDMWVAVEDQAAVSALWGGHRDRLAGRDLDRALGFKPAYLLVTLSPPRQGYCYKRVSAFLPRP